MIMCYGFLHEILSPHVLAQTFRRFASRDWSKRYFSQYAPVFHMRLINRSFSSTKPFKAGVYHLLTYEYTELVIFLRVLAYYSFPPALLSLSTESRTKPFGKPEGQPLRAAPKGRVFTHELVTLRPKVSTTHSHSGNTDIVVHLIGYGLLPTPTTAR